MTAPDITRWLEDLGLGQYAGAFRSEQIDLPTLVGLTEADLERLGVATMGHRKRLLQAIGAIGETLPGAAALRNLVAALPTPVALPLADHLAESDPRLKLWAACEAVEDLLRLLVFLGVGELTRRCAGLPDGLRQNLHRMIEAPTMGRWRRMAEALARQAAADLAEDSALPELLPSVVETLAPFLDGPQGQRTPRRSFQELRNRFAHGGFRKAQAAGLLAIWQPPFESLWQHLAWLADLDLVVRTAHGFGTLRGPGTTPQPLATGTRRDAISPAIAGVLEEHLGRGDAVVAVRGERVIPLWPLALFGVPHHPLDQTDADTPPLPQVYVRLGQVNLQYRPLGDTGLLQSEPGDADAKDRFLALFRPTAPPPKGGERPVFTVQGFEEGFRSLAARLIGRERERDLLRRAIDETRRGVLWLDGPAGIGKSYLVADLADVLLTEDRPDTLVLGYQFRADDARCARDPFLRFAGERIAAFLGQDPAAAPAPEQKQIRPLDRLKALIDAFASGPAGGRRLIFLLDGTDEITERDRRFVAEIPLAIQSPTLTWLCAGRPEQGLPEAFVAAGARRVFPDGLPPMGADDIRAMLMEKIGALRKTLLRRDTEQGEHIANPFVDKVARLSEGLPLYVKYVVEDVLAGRYRVLDAGETLPPGLDAYHAELIRRLGIGDLQQILTPLAATLAVAQEPLSALALSDLLHRREELAPEGEHGRALVRKALGLIQSMIRAARTPPDRDGQDESGYVLYHHSLAQHMAESDQSSHAVDSARRFLAKQAQTVRTGPLAPYLYRRGIAHLLETGEPKAALALLTDFDYLMDRLRALPDPDAMEGLGADWRAVLRQVSIHDHATRLWEAFFREREHILRRGDWRWPAYKILLQLAVEHAGDSPLTIAAERWLAEGMCDWDWLRNPQRVRNARPDPCLRVLDGHPAWVVGVLLLPNGRILSWSEDRTLRLWDGESGAELAAFVGHTHSVDGAAPLPDGRILSWSDDNTLRLWDGASGAPLATLAGHTDSVCGALPLPDGRILSWSWDGTLRLWGSESGTPLAVLAGHTDWVDGALLLPDGRILSWSADHSLRTWDGASGLPLATLVGHTAPVSASLLRDGRILSWSSAGTLCLWDGESGTLLVRLGGHTGWVSGALQLADGRILSWSGDQTLRLWDDASGASRATLTGHSGEVKGALPLPNGRILSWSADKTLRLWDAESGAPLATLAGHTDSVNGALPLPNGRIVSSSKDRTLRLWDGENGALLATFAGHTDSTSGPLLLPDGRVLSWSIDGTLRLWDVENLAPVIALRGHESHVQGVAPLPDGRIVSWSSDKTLRLWDGSSGLPLATLAGHTDWVSHALVLPGGRILSWSTGLMPPPWLNTDNTLRLWEGHTGILLASLAGHTGPVSGALLLPDQRILSWSQDSTLRLWDGQIGAPLAILDGHAGPVYGALPLPDGRILSWSTDKTLRLWDGQSGALHKTLVGHTDSFSGALLLPDGRILSWSKDKTLRLWDGQSGALHTTLVGHTDAVAGALLLPSGRILSWSKDKTLRLWDGQSGSLHTTLVGHTDAVAGALPLPDGRILSWSIDHTLRLWDSESGAPISTVSGHKSQLLRTKLLPDGRILSWSADNTLHTWNDEDGQLIGEPVALWRDFPTISREILPYLRELLSDAVISGGAAGWSSGRSAGVAACASRSPPIYWQGQTNVESKLLLPEGVLVVRLHSFHIFCLQLYRGNRRMTIEEYERGDPERDGGADTMTPADGSVD